MLSDDAIDPLFVFRRPGTRGESAAARRLFGDGSRDVADDRTVRAYVLVDIEGLGATAVVAAVEVSASSGSWRVLRVGGDERHLPRLAAELVRTAIAAGTACVTVAPGASEAARHLIGTLRTDVREAGGWISIEL